MGGFSLFSRGGAFFTGGAMVGLAVCTLPPMANLIYGVYTNVWPPGMAGKVMGIAKGMERFEVTKAAVELGMFEYLEGGPATAERVAKGIGASERGTTIVLEYLKTLSLVRSKCRWKSPCEYSLAPSAKMFLVESAGPMNLGHFMAMVLGNDEKHVRYQKAKDAIVRGGIDPHKDSQDGRYNNNEYYRDFAQATWNIAYEPAKRMAKFIPTVLRRNPSQVLDIACGSGAYGAVIAKMIPKVKVTALDQAVVIPAAKKIIDDFGGVSDRFTFLTGSAFDVPLPARKFDVVVVSNFIHLFDPKTTTDLLKRFRTAVAPNGILLINDLIRHDKPSVTAFDDFSPVEFNFNMLATTAKGQTYSIPELDAVFASAGLQRVATKRNFPFPFTFVAAKVL